MLQNIRIASPCSADWEKMEGNDRVRFCSACQLNVYNFSEMTEREVRQLIQSHEGRRLCGRLYRRKDGTLLTRNCPVALRAVVRRLSRVAGAVLSFLTPSFAVAQTQTNIQTSQSQNNGQNPVSSTGLELHVTDKSGAVVGNADVVLKQKGGKIEIQGKTDASGKVFFPAFSNGEYVIKVTSAGFQVFRKNLKLHSGETLSVQVHLRNSEEVTVGVLVTAEAPMIDTSPTVSYELLKPE